MTNQPAESGEEGSKKTLVRVLIIVGIGIPVLVELLTLFNLVNVQLFEDEKAVRQQATATEVQEFMIGDTLFSDAAAPIAISDMLIKVSAQSWRFELALAPSGTTAAAGTSVTVDSLELKSGEILADAQIWKIGNDPKIPKKFDWVLPSGDVPSILYMSTNQVFPKDSVATLEQQFKLGSVPVRYSQENGAN